MPVPKKFSATTASVASPIGGWNARDSVAEMNPLDAVVLENFFPTPSQVQLRKGYTQFATGITGQVDTLMNYAGGTTQKLFASAGSTIYEVTGGGAATSVVTGLGSDRWEYVNASTAGGNFLTAVNGTDAALIYDGTTWIKYANISTAQTISNLTASGTTCTLTTSVAHGLSTGNQVTITGASPSAYNGTFKITVTSGTTFTYTALSAPASSPASPLGSYTVAKFITGVDSANLAHVNLHKDRLYFVEENSLRFWYLGANAISGAASSFDLGGVARMGGYIQAMGTWTLDAGYGVDDYAVFITNNGEAIVYKGSDPSDANDWALIGVWQLGQVFTRRCFFKFAGDLLLITQDGIVPLAASLQSTRLDPRIFITDKIYNAVSEAADLYSTEFGWQIQYFAKFNMLIFNIPVIGGIQQFVMHNITKAWANFTGINATCFEIHNENMYFGGNGYVGKFYDGLSDNDTNIKATCQQAYSYFDARGQLKRFTMVRPILFVDNGTPTVLCGINTDFETQNSLGQVSYNPALINVGVWDTSLWDDVEWGGGNNISKNWQGVTGLGYAAGISLNIASQDIDVRWASTDYVMEKGGVLQVLCLDKMAVGTWVGNQCGMVFTPENSTAIGWIKDGEICAGVWYEDYNKVSVVCHIALTRQMTPAYLNIIFDYPFVQLGVDKIIVPVVSDNEASIKFVKNLGFEEKAQLLDVFPSGDLLFFVMTKDKCRFIGERYGKRRGKCATTT